MKSGSKRLAGWLVALVTIAWPVHADAHAPYERLAATITDPSGRTLQVVARYTDGIIGTDPMTIVIRDASGTTLAETAQARDAIVRCPSYESCRVFLYEPPFNIFPLDVVRLDSTGFISERVARHLIVGALLPVRHHFLELVVASLTLAWVPIVAQMLARRRRTPLVVVAWWVFVPLSFAWGSLWLFGTTLNTRVPFVWLAVGVGSYALLPFARDWFRAATSPEIVRNVT